MLVIAWFAMDFPVQQLSRPDVPPEYGREARSLVTATPLNTKHLKTTTFRLSAQSTPLKEALRVLGLQSLESAPASRSLSPPPASPQLRIQNEGFFLDGSFNSIKVASLERKQRTNWFALL